MRGRPGLNSKKLVDGFIKRGKRFIHLAEAVELSGTSEKTFARMLERLALDGDVIRLERGLYGLAGEELNPLAVGRELAGGVNYYISNGSAMELWGMDSDPHPPSGDIPDLPPFRGKEALREAPAAEVIVTLTDKRRMRPRRVMGVEYRFVNDNLLAAGKMVRLTPRPEHWRMVEVEVSRGEFVWVSDPEWTVLSGLARPDLCGGIDGVARAVWNWQGRLDLDKLVKYANHIRNRTAVRRLGYVLEALGMHTEESEFVLGFSVFSSYGRLEPGRPAGGELYRKWRLDVNVELGNKDLTTENSESTEEHGGFLGKK